MYTDNIAVKERPITDAISRRGVGKAMWKRMIDELIASEKEDLKDLQALRNRMSGDPQAMRLIAALQERKTERVIQLNELLRYSDKDSRIQD